MAFVKKKRIDAKKDNQTDNYLNYSQSFKLLDLDLNSNKTNYNSCHNFTKIKTHLSKDLKNFKLLCEPKWMEKFLSGEIEPNYFTSERSHNVVDYICSRTIDYKGSRRAQLQELFPIRHLLTNNLLREQLYECQSFNKVFSSQWLNDRQVIFGTKCNKLIVLNVMNGKQHLIPTLKSSKKTREPENPCGIHAIEINPSQTLLATGGDNPNDVAVYRLPTLDPLCVGEGAHSDWIFDMTWLDDQFLISGSRDSTIALWRFPELDNESPERVCSLSIPEYSHQKPLMTKLCKNAEKIRALLYNKKEEEVAILSLNANLHLFDSQTLVQKYSIKLPFCLENVCLSQQMESNLYAVGSKSHVTLLDNKTYKEINKILSKNQGTGIRSLSFHNELLTIGTGVGTVLFYDIRANKYLENTTKKSHSFLKASKGYVSPEDLFSDYFFQIEYSPAIYTHHYDSSKTRLFVAGGPLPASLQGSYTGLWK